MKEQKILPLIAAMSLPMVISMAVNALYNIVDSYFVAKISDDAMTALSLVFPIQNMVNAIAIGFGIGVNACIAFFLGAEKKDKADMSASWGVLLSLLHGILLTVVCIAVMPAFLRIFTKEENILNLAISYSNRVFLFAAAVNVGICYEKIFQAVGKMRVSMFSMMAGCVANIILDPLMIFGIGSFPAMGIQGAAYATGNRTMPDVSGLSAPVLAQTDSGKGTARIFKKGGDIDWQIIPNRCTGYSEYGAALRTDFCFEPDIERFFRTICAGAWNLL